MELCERPLRAEVLRQHTCKIDSTSPLKSAAQLRQYCPCKWSLTNHDSSARTPHVTTISNCRNPVSSHSSRHTPYKPPPY
jgi:hypothetical protein